MPELTDDDVFGPQELSDADVFGAPRSRSVGERITDALGAVSPALARGALDIGRDTRMLGNALGVVSNQDMAEEAARHAIRIQQYAPPPEMAERMAALDRAGQVGLLEAGQAMLADPMATFNTLAQSIPAMAVMAGTGGAAGLMGRAALGAVAGRIGMALGTGAGSFATDFGSTVLDHIRDSGVDITNPQALQAYMNDPIKMTEAINAGLRHSTVVAAFDTASGGLAGRTMHNVASARQAVGRLARETGEQAALGASGEAGGQLAQYGNINNWTPVLMEGIGEVALGGPMEVATGALVTRPRQAVEAPAAPQQEAPPADTRWITDPTDARDVLTRNNIDHSNISDERAVVAANRIVERLGETTPDTAAREQQYMQEVHALTGSTYNPETGQRRWNNAEYGKLQTRIATLEAERGHLVDPKAIAKNLAATEKAQAKLNALVNELDTRFADIHQRPFVEKGSQTGLSEPNKPQDTSERPIIVDRQGQAYPESPLLHEQGRGAEPGLVRTGNAPPRMMTPGEVTTADRFGLRNLWAGTTPEGVDPNLKMVGEVYGALAKKFDIPERAVGLGGELNLYNVQPAGAYGDYTPANKSIRSPADFTSTMVHEWVHALDNALGERAGTTWASLARMPGPLGEAWRAVVNSLQNSPNFLRASRALPNPQYWTDPREMLSRAVEATWADWFKGTDFAKQFHNKIAKSNIQPYPRGAELDRIKNALENFIKKLTVVPKKDSRMGHVFEPLVPGGQHTEATPGGPLLERLQASAYHGTGHQGFDRFSTEHIGSGEGAQAYGWGLYFASKRDIAKYYKDKLTRKTNTSGALYKVELAPAEHEYLDLDKTLDQQSNTVKEALKKIPERIWDSMTEALDAAGHVGIDPDSSDYTGKQLQYILTKFATEDAFPGIDTDGTEPKKDVSLYLHSLGIRGNKYFDGGSRGRGDGSHNYVIFDDKDVSIVERLESGNGKTNIEAIKQDIQMAREVPAAAARARARAQEQAEIQNSRRPEGEKAPPVETAGRQTLMDEREVQAYLNGKASPENRLRGWSAFWHTPLYLADKFPAFRPWMNALLNFSRTRAQKMHFYLDTIQPLTQLPKKDLVQVTRFAEAVNSMRVVPKRAADGSYTITVGPLATQANQPGSLNAPIVGSKTGDVLKLTGAQAEAYAATRKALDTFYDDLYTSTLAKLGIKQQAEPGELRQLAQELGGHEGAKLNIAADILEQVRVHKIQGYIPQMRTGKARLLIMKPERKNGKIALGEDGFPTTPIDSEAAADRTWSIPFDAFTTRGAFHKANAYMKRMEKRFPASEGWVMYVKEMNQSALLDTITPTERGLNAVENLANLFMSDQEPLHTKDGKEIDGLDHLLTQLAELKAKMGERGFRASLSKRRDLPGWLREENYDTYLPSAVGAYLVRGSNFIARNYHFREMQDAKNELYGQKRQDLLSYVQAQEADMTSPKAFTNFIKGMAFNWFLGWRLGSAAVNLTQVPQTSMPYLSMVSNTRRAGMELLRAAKQIIPILKLATTEEKSINWNKKPSGISQAHWDALKRGRDEGWLSAVVSHEQSGRVASVVDDSYLMGGLGRTFGPKIQTVLKTMPVFFSTVEQFNRMTTALAAMRLADDPKVLAGFERVAKGTAQEGQKLDSYTAARMAVERTQFLISDINRPTMMRGSLGGIATQFMQFPIAITELWMNVMRNAGVRPKDAVKFVAPALLGLIATSGLWGIPGGQDGNDLIKALSRIVGPMFGLSQLDIQREVQHWLTRSLRELGVDDNTAFGVPEVLFKGLPRLLGVDMSRRASANLNIADMLFSSDPAKVMGPGGAMIINSAQDAIGYYMHGHPYLAMSALMPSFARDMVHAVEGWQGRGPISPTTGNSRYPAGEQLRGRAGLYAVGLTPTDAARASEEVQGLRYRPMQQQIAYWNERLSDSMADAMAAARRGDSERAAASRAEFQRILGEMRDTDRGRPPEERVLRANTMQNVMQAARAKVRGPVEAALRRLPQVERVPAQRNLNETYPRSVR